MNEAFQSSYHVSNSTFTPSQTCQPIPSISCFLINAHALAQVPEIPFQWMLMLLGEKPPQLYLATVAEKLSTNLQNVISVLTSILVQLMSFRVSWRTS
jgi:hypothetical protein